MGYTMCSLLLLLIGLGMLDPDEIRSVTTRAVKDVGTAVCLDTNGWQHGCLYPYTAAVVPKRRKEMPVSRAWTLGVCT